MKKSLFALLLGSFLAVGGSYAMPPSKEGLVERPPDTSVTCNEVSTLEFMGITMEVVQYGDFTFISSESITVVIPDCKMWAEAPECTKLQLPVWIDSPRIPYSMENWRGRLPKDPKYN